MNDDVNVKKQHAIGATKQRNEAKERSKGERERERESHREWYMDEWYYDGRTVVTTLNVRWCCRRRRRRYHPYAMRGHVASTLRTVCNTISTGDARVTENLCFVCVC